MRLRIRFSLTIGDEKSETPRGPDFEAQIGTHHDAGTPAMGLGFTHAGMEDE